MAFMGITGYKIDIVTDSFSFLESIFEAGRRIMLNPYRTERNTTRWTEVTKAEYVKKADE